VRRSLVAASVFGLVISLTASSPLNGAQKQGKQKDGAAKAKANDGVITNWGKPKGFDTRKDDVNAYWLWYDDGIWHLRTTGGAKGAPRFKGLIEVADGKLAGLDGTKGEFKGKHRDQFVFNPARTAIAFNFKTDESVDGLDFAVTPSATLKFTLAINGDAAPKHIRIGHDGDHPAAAVFTAPGHPPDPPDTKGKKK
jgi:hypothetical protein